MVAVVGASITLAVMPAFACEDGSSWTCNTVNSGTQLDIVGSQTDPGVTPPTSGPGVALPPPRPERPSPSDRGAPDCAPDTVACTPVYEDAPPPADEEADAIPPVTLADLASFVPAQPALGAEPAAAGVAGMPTNFVAVADEQILGGSLFGRPVSVRFTPVAYVFSYGDGTTARSSTGGTSWDALGQPQFTATPTSHAYSARGTYVASVAVEYAPAVDFGTGWIPVAGVVTAAGPGYQVEVYEVRTALVERTCIENPSGPGC